MIHQYKNNGYNIVLDVYSGAVHVVDDLCYDVIAVLNEPDEEPTAEILKSDLTWENLKKRLGDTYSEVDLRDALDDVIELTEDGKLFTKDEFEYLVPIVKKRKTVVKALCLHIAHESIGIVLAIPVSIIITSVMMKMSVKKVKKIC